MINTEDHADNICEFPSGNIKFWSPSSLNCIWALSMCCGTAVVRDYDHTWKCADCSTTVGRIPLDSSHMSWITSILHYDQYLNDKYNLDVVIQRWVSIWTDLHASAIEVSVRE